MCTSIDLQKMVLNIRILQFLVLRKKGGKSVPSLAKLVRRKKHFALLLEQTLSKTIKALIKVQKI